MLNSLKATNVIVLDAGESRGCSGMLWTGEKVGVAAGKDEEMESVAADDMVSLKLPSALLPITDCLQFMLSSPNSWTFELHPCSITPSHSLNYQ